MGDHLVLCRLDYLAAFTAVAIIKDTTVIFFIKASPTMIVRPASEEGDDVSYIAFRSYIVSRYTIHTTYNEITVSSQGGVSGFIC